MQIIGPEQTIVVTGAAGFIGSYVVGALNRAGYDRLILVDDFGRADKAPNLAGKRFAFKLHRDAFLRSLEDSSFHPPVAAVLHLGARTDTTEMDYAVHERLNLRYSQVLWRHCAAAGIPFYYASSAATYGAGEHGYNDSDAVTPLLQPLNPYGLSKLRFDQWVLAQSVAPPVWAGLRFFNVYGPNEYHKGRMASVIFHAFNQIQGAGRVRLFRSHRTDYADGAQARDFVHVADVTAVCLWLLQGGASASGIFNLGSGRARTFNHLAGAVFSALGKPAAIDYIDTPQDIRDTYQYFTEADLAKLRGAGYSAPMRSLEEGITSYVRDYLAPHAYF